MSTAPFLIYHNTVLTNQHNYDKIKLNNLRGDSYATNPTRFRP
jgi:V8-like Glu-specific endopeptidase